ncbi:MAG: ATP-binding protein [Leptolyngbyaceae bacterium]|nr:ATP-binding protein [Leptolyngbyaceae bacterium]
MQKPTPSQPAPWQSRILSRVPLRLLLTVPFMFQVVGAVSLVGYLSFRTGQAAVKDVAQQLRSEISGRIEQRLDSYLEAPSVINQVNIHAILSQQLDPADPSSFTRQFWSQRFLFDRVKLSAMYFGTAQGDFFGLGFQNNQAWEVGLRNAQTQGNFYSYAVDNQGNPTTVLRRGNAYDPRIRPWYEKAIAANGPQWSDIYIDFIEDRLKLTLAEPVKDDQGQLLGVIGTDFVLSHIQDFLGELEVSESGQTFIIDRSGLLIATSTSEPLWQSIERDAPNDGTAAVEEPRLSAIDSPHPLIGTTAAYITQRFNQNLSTIETPQSFSFSHPDQKETIYVQVTPWKDELGLDWLIVILVPESDFMAQIQANTRTTVTLCLVALLITLGSGFLTAQWVSQPILNLKNTAKSVANGNLDQHIERRGTEEIQSLSNSFEQMLVQLRHFFTELEAKNADLKRLDQLKDEFLANTSHELRTPLNGIIGLSESLMDGAAGEVTIPVRRNLELIAISAKRLSHLVNDILDFSKLKHQTIELQIKPVSLRTTIDLIFIFLYPLANQKSLSLKNQIDRNFPMIDADENRLQQIFFNLIGNAIKFTEAGSISISASIIPAQPLTVEIDESSSVPKDEILANAATAEAVMITVTDTGIGIAPEKCDRIFESFEQVDGSTARQYGGTGLGLAITKQLIELHGGEIWVESEVGKGSQFKFKLPLKQPGYQTEIPDPTSTAVAIFTEQYKEQLGEPFSDKFSDKSSEQSSEQSIPNPNTISTWKANGIGELQPMAPGTQSITATVNDRCDRSDSEKLKILVVDDEPINRQVLTNYLSLYGYEVVESSNGSEALDKIATGFKPDLVLLDIMMPSMTGYEVCHHLRSQFSASELPIVMLTAKSQIEDLIEGFNLGANDYLRKPFSKDELLARIRSHVDLAKTNAACDRFVPHNFLKFLGRDSILDVELGDQTEQEMTVMFADIRSFTTLSEDMSPEENFAFINDYLSHVGPIVEEFNGFIDKFIGDGLMALFPESADDAVRAAIAIQQQVTVFNHHRQRLGKPPIQVGIGLHIGDLMLGIVGSLRRMDSTVIADAVNLAARLEGLNKAYKSQILISQALLDRLQSPEQYQIRFLDNVQVKGKRQAVSVLEIYDGNTEEQRRLKQQTESLFQQALTFLMEGNVDAARAPLAEVLRLNPEDGAAQWHWQRYQ